MDEIIVRCDPPSIALVTINRPRKRNAVNQAMWQELGRVFAALSDDPDVRAVILTGAGGQFCAGADISEFPEVRGNAEQAERYEADGRRAEDALANLRKPTIAAISGYAVGGGCGLALCCDFRLADATARMGIPAARLGIVYSMSECQKLYSAVGAANAKRVLFTGRIFNAADCARMGLIDGIVEGEVLDGAIALAESMAENAPLSIEGSKVAINALAAGRADARAAEHEAIMYRAFDSADYREGARAFMEKRRPEFTGR